MFPSLCFKQQSYSTNTVPGSYEPPFLINWCNLECDYFSVHIHAHPKLSLQKSSPPNGTDDLHHVVPLKAHIGHDHFL